VTAESPTTRMLSALRRRDLDSAVLSHPETVANLAGYLEPVEDYPVAHPYVSDPALLVLSPTATVLVVADAYAALVEGIQADPILARSYDYLAEPDPLAGKSEALAEALARCGCTGGRLGVEPGWLPMRTADELRRLGFELCDVESDVVASRAVKLPVEIEALRAAAGLADVAQRTVKERAEPGVTEAELAGIAQAAMNRHARMRVPTFLNLTTGPASAAPPWEPTGRRILVGDIILTDVAPWCRGAWGDSANAVVMGPPDAEHRRVFDALRRALETGIAACRPGVEAREVDRVVREQLEPFGGYPHHTGHALGASWSEEPRLAPYNTRRVEEGMVMAVEPSVYRAGWGGMRLEHMFLVKAGGNELLTKFEHTL
jgi:Xaa-Pro aminopeptidase